MFIRLESLIGCDRLARRPAFIATVALFVLVFVSPKSYAKSIDWPKLNVRATNGDAIRVDPQRLTVVAFLGTECPLARLYGPRLQSLCDRYKDRGVQFLGVVSNVQDSPSEIDDYCKQYGIEFSIAKDADQSIADAFQATRTPEVFVVDRDGAVRYQGRIDDQYEPGVSRAAPTRHDLRDAVEALVGGRPVAVAKTTGVGCLITRLKKTKRTSSGDADVTFHRDIVPVLNRHCVECHRKGEIGPMELTDYDEVVGWGQMILEVVDQGRMPPWHADPAIGHFVGERRMPKSDRDALAAWVEEGMPEGDAADRPASPTWNSGWHLASDPDFEIEMRGKPFRVPADGVVEYQYFVVDPQWTEDRWIKAAQVIPGDASVVHHTIVFVRPPDGSEFGGIGWLGAYVPGQRSVPLPEGHARLVPAGSKLVFQMHYTPNGRVTEDITRLGVWEADPDEVTHEVFTQMAIDHKFEIPPGAKDFTVEMSVNSFPPSGRMLGITPHMHLRGKSFELEAHYAGGQSEPLLRVPNYDFNWQHWYAFAEPVDLNATRSLRMKVRFDNSAANPFNPDPNEYVSWGDQTWQEMAVAFFDVAIKRGAPRYRIRNGQAADRRAEKRPRKKNPRLCAKVPDRNGSKRGWRHRTRRSSRDLSALWIFDRRSKPRQKNHSQ